MNAVMYKNYTKRRLFIIDELALVLAYFTALLLRHGSGIAMWADYFEGIYVSVLVVAVLVQALVFIFYDYSKPILLNQELIKSIVSIVKGRFILFISIVLYLYMMKQGENSSRFVVPATAVIDIFYTFILRTLYKIHYIHKYGRSEEVLFDITYPYPMDDEFDRILSGRHYDKALIHTYDEKKKIRATEDEINHVVKVVEAKGVHPYVSLETLGYKVRDGIVCDIKDYATIPVSVRNEKFGLFGVGYSIARTEEAVLHVVRHIKELSGKYICFSNVHTVVMAKENKEYCEVLNGAAFVFADGTPIAQRQQKSGYEYAERIAGPDFMEHMFRATADGSLSHYFYGASQETLDILDKSLRKKYPDMVIKGMYSPPFRKLTEEEDQADIDRINEANADIVWIGLGAPKQEKWMQMHRDKIHGVMMGVGAGFDIHAGTIKRAPKWIQRIGFEWLYRLFQDPKRLIRRYFVTNIKYFWYSLMERFVV